MLSSSPAWRDTIQRFQNASEGKKLRDCLVECILMCDNSHHVNVGFTDEYYNDLIRWEPGGGWSPLEPSPTRPLPDDWEINDLNEYVQQETPAPEENT